MGKMGEMGEMVEMVPENARERAPGIEQPQGDLPRVPGPKGGAEPSKFSRMPRADQSASNASEGRYIYTSIYKYHDEKEEIVQSVCRGLVG